MAGIRSAGEQSSMKSRAQKKTTAEEENRTPGRALRSFFTCRYDRTSMGQGGEKRGKRIGCSGSLCNLRENGKIVLSNSPERSKGKIWSGFGGWSSRSMKAPLSEINGVVFSSSSTSSSSSSSAFRGMHLGRFSGCYECHVAGVPINGGAVGDSSLRGSICSCPDCGEMFMKPESLERHQILRHAVLELGLNDTSRNIVEIIFQSSWLKKQAPILKIQRILKIRNSEKTIARFEDYRNSIKCKASEHAKKYPRCIADGNELLRFHCTTFTCSLGINGSTNLCGGVPRCRMCGIVRDEIKTDALGRIRTMSTSRRAHDFARVSSEKEKRGMLVCRVIAGRVKRSQDSSGEFDSMLGSSGVHSGLDEIFVLNSKAILPCFVVVYEVL
ncbi:hypothetical protein KSP39_PZI017439 [Platanthera zijinensis]|uniref:C2H2-type domain-containing protein n=1 Tax=Platanthera zijinensis TaxID=2320716 RepID=A0AAP0B4U7_9ASPA